MTETTPSLPASGHGEVAGLVEIAHDGFRGTIQGRYVTREGKPGVVLQQDGTRVVHVYGEKWIPAEFHAPTPPPVEARADGVREDRGLCDCERGSNGLGISGRACDCRPASGLEALDRKALSAARKAYNATLNKEWKTHATEHVIETYLAALESTPAQPVREGQEGKAEPVWFGFDENTGEFTGEYSFVKPHDTRGMVPFVRALASQPDPAAEIAKLKDPNAAHVMMLRGEIAKPTECQIRHLYPKVDSAFVDLEKALLALVDADHSATKAIARAERAESELAVIREALEPFARIADEYSAEEDDDFQVWKDFDVLGATLPLKIFRRARAALANTADRGQEEKGNG